ncbi:MAG: transglycosylase domain-containing protein, partial [Cyanobacteriota bacterium]
MEEPNPPSAVPSSDPPSAAPPASTRALWISLVRSAGRGSWRQRSAAIARAWLDLRQRNVWLELWLGEQRVSVTPLESRRYRLGRDPGCDLSIASANLSRVHAILEREHPADRDFALEDFNSANGLFHRDRRIRSIRLRDGDRVHFGSPLKGEAPSLVYRHPRSALERTVHGFGVGALLGSAVLVSALLAAATLGGGSRIRLISGPVKILAADGRQIDAKEGSATALPSLASYPMVLRQALLASEDARFGWNSGLDLYGIARSLVRRSGGASGLTQQVARLYYPEVGNDLSVTRKLRELWVALQLEVGYSKNQIMKMYLDRAYLGLGTEGFEQASRLYFRKGAGALDAQQAAFLVGLLPNPNGYSPCNTEHPTWGRERRDLVLQRMQEQGYLGEQASIDARRRPLNIDPSACRTSSFQSYPFFSDYVLGEVQGARFGLNLRDQSLGGNYVVVSTIDPDVQKLAQDELRHFLEGPAARVGLTQGALISLNYDNGDILAYVGGGDYEHSSYDRVQAMRQPGSTFKLFSYLAGLQAGVSPGDPISCAPLAYVAGCHSSAGSLSMADGLVHSENVVALRLAETAGLTQVLRLARHLGITTPLEADYNMVLGGRETLLYEMARAYAVVAHGGRTVPMHGVSKIYDLGVCQSVLSLDRCPSHGVTIPIGESPRQLVPGEVAADMDQLLAGVVQRGTGRAAAVVPDARGKTGTTNNGVDVLFIGYSPSSRILTAIWMGNDDN